MQKFELLKFSCCYMILSFRKKLTTELLTYSHVKYIKIQSYLPALCPVIQWPWPRWRRPWWFWDCPMNSRWSHCDPVRRFKMLAEILWMVSGSTVVLGTCHDMQSVYKNSETLKLPKRQKYSCQCHINVKCWLKKDTTPQKTHTRNFSYWMQQ